MHPTQGISAALNPLIRKGLPLRARILISSNHPAYRSFWWAVLCNSKKLFRASSRVVLAVRDHETHAHCGALGSGVLAKAVVVLGSHVNPAAPGMCGVLKVVINRGAELTNVQAIGSTTGNRHDP